MADGADRGAGVVLLCGCNEFHQFHGRNQRDYGRIFIRNVVAVAVDIAHTLARGAHVAQSDAGLVSIGYAEHPLSVVDGELVHSLVSLGVNAEPLVVAVEEGALVAGATTVGAVAGIEVRRGDVGISFNGCLVGAAAGAEHIVASAAAGTMHAVAHTGRPGARVSGQGVEIGGIVKSRTSRL